MNENPCRLIERHTEAMVNDVSSTTQLGVKQNRSPDISTLLTGFAAISLEATNRCAKLLTRIDNKYAITFDQFRSLLTCINDDYSILEIDGLRQFSYSSCYYDDDFGCYFEHHQGRRQRMKVRTREYVDSGLKFFEIKLKGLRGKTNKYRTDCDFLVTPRIQNQFSELLNSVYQEQYKKAMPFKLSPSLMINYQRCTLVARQGGERVTIDFSLCFDQPEGISAPVHISNEFIIVETKSGDGKGITDRAMKKLNIRKASKCSKYCIGVNLMGKVRKNNNFLHMIKHVKRNIVSPGSGFPKHDRVPALVSSELRVVQS